MKKKIFLYILIIIFSFLSSYIYAGNILKTIYSGIEVGEGNFEFAISATGKYVSKLNVNNLEVDIYYNASETFSITYSVTNLDACEPYVIVSNPSSSKKTFAVYEDDVFDDDYHGTWTVNYHPAIDPAVGSFAIKSSDIDDFYHDTTQTEEPYYYLQSKNTVSFDYDLVNVNYSDYGNKNNYYIYSDYDNYYEEFTRSLPDNLKCYFRLLVIDSMDRNSWTPKKYFVPDNVPPSLTKDITTEYQVSSNNYYQYFNFNAIDESSATNHTTGCGIKEKYLVVSESSLFTPSEDNDSSNLTDSELEELAGVINGSGELSDPTEEGNELTEEELSNLMDGSTNNVLRLGVYDNGDGSYWSVIQRERGYSYAHVYLYLTDNLGNTYIKDISEMHKDIDSAVQIFGSIDIETTDGEEVHGETKISTKENTAEYSLEYALVLPDGATIYDTRIDEIILKNLNNNKEKIVYRYSENLSDLYAYPDTDANGEDITRYLFKGTIDDDFITDLDTSIPVKIIATTTWIYSGGSYPEDSDLIELKKSNISLRPDGNDIKLTVTKVDEPSNYSELVGEYSCLNLLADGAPASSTDTIYTKYPIKIEITDSDGLKTSGIYHDINNEALSIGSGLSSGTLERVEDTSITLKKVDFDGGSEPIVYVVEDQPGDDASILYSLNKTMVYDDEISNESLTRLLYTSSGETLEGSNNITNEMPDYLYVSVSELDHLENAEGSGLSQIEVSIESDSGSYDSGILYSESYDELVTANGAAYYKLDFSEVSLEDGEYNTVLCIRDKAGNERKEINSFVIDTVAIDIPETFNNFSVLSEDNTITDYDYDPTHRNLSVAITRDPDFWGGENLDNCDFSISIPSGEESSYEGYSIGSSSTEDGFEVFHITLPEGFDSNALKRVDFTVQDAGGNPNTKEDISFHLPVILGTEIADYLEQTGDEYIVDADTGKVEYHLGWRNSSSEILKLYRIRENNSPDPIEAEANESPALFIDRDVDAHGNYEYAITGINGSGYEGGTDNESLVFERQVNNIQPEFVAAEYRTRYDGGDAYYMGPGAQIEVSCSDLDEGDTIEGSIAVETEDGYEPIVVYEVLGGDDEKSIIFDCFAVMNAYKAFAETEDSVTYTEGEEINLVYAWQDKWTTIDGNGAGNKQYKELDPFIYDENVPELTFLPDYKEGYSTSFDGFQVFLDDSNGQGFGYSGLSENGCTIKVYNNSDTSEEPYLESVLTGEDHFSLEEGATYYIEIDYKDNVGNGAEFTELNFVVDTAKPVVEGFEITGAEEGLYYTNTMQIPLQGSWLDSMSGVKEVNIDVIQDEELLFHKLYTVGTEDNGFLSTEGDISRNIAMDLGKIDVEKNISFDIVLIDFAGNESNVYEISDEASIDLRAPVVSVDEKEVFSIYNTKRYLNDKANLELLAESVSDFNPVTGGYWVLTHDDVQYSGSMAEVFGNITVEGEYSLCYKAVDAAGNTGSSSDIVFSYDVSSPEFTEAGLETVGNVYPKDYLRFELNATDDSPIDSYSIWAGLLGDDEAGLTNLVDGNMDGVVSVDGAEREYILEVPDVDEGNYIVKIKAVDVCGNESEYQLLYQLDISIPDNYVTLTDRAEYSNDIYGLSAVAEYHGEKTISLYTYRAVEITDGVTIAISDWYESDTELLEVEFDEALEEGHRYAIEAIGQCEDGYIVDATTSVGTIIDVTSPELTGFDVDMYTSEAMVTAGWDCNEDNLAGMELVFRSYDVDEYGELVREKIDGIEYYYSLSDMGNRGLEVEASAADRKIEFPEDAALECGRRYAVSLLVWDKAGNVGESELLTVIYDNTAANVDGIIDRGDYINPDYDALEFSLGSAVTDGESGIASVEYQLISGSDGLSDDGWTEFGDYLDINPVITVTEVPADGESAVLALRVVNNAGIESISYSNGIIIDTTKPGIANIVLNENKAYSYDMDLPVVVSSYDTTSSVVSIEYTQGVFTDGVWSGLSETVNISENIESFNKITIDSSLVNEDERCWFEFVVTDSAGNTSLPYYSLGILLNPQIASIKKLNSEYSDGKIKMSWSVDENALQPEKLDVILLYNDVTGDTEIAKESLDGDLVYWEYETEVEGNYRFEITAKSLDKYKTASKTVIVDRSAPVISGLNASRYVSDSIDFECVFSDSVSYVNQWKYRIGKSGDEGVITGGWVTGDNVRNVIAESLLFSELAGGENVEDKDNLVVEVAARDRFGNWSAVANSGWSLVDLTAPEEVVIDISEDTIRFDGADITCVNRYLSRSTAVDGVTIYAEDGESGVMGYRWHVAAVSEETPVIPEDSPFMSLDNVTAIMNDGGLSFKGLTLEDGNIYKVYISLRNQAGVDSDWYESPEVIADFSSSTAMISINEDEQAGFDELYDRPVVNGDAGISIECEDSLSEAMLLELRIYDPDTELVAEEQYLVSENPGSVSYDFTPENGKYGVYLIEVDIEDAAGNESSGPATLNIRYNAPPQLNLPEVIEVNPGRPFTLNADDYGLYDSDGVARVIYTISRDDYDDNLEPVSVSDDVETSLLHSSSAPRAKVTEYTLSCYVEDEYGQPENYNTVIDVVNTEEGLLYVDEYWSGTHYLTGRVTIPEGLKLTILDSTEILCNGGISGAEPAELMIENGAELVHEGDAEYRLSEDMGVLWNGIYLDGTGNFNGIAISGARRGLVVTADARCDAISDCIFENNDIGLHILKSNVRVRNSYFRDNRHYGIKEDESSDPQVSYNTFGGNGHDYYDTELTVIDDMNVLNGLERRNRGNVKTDN